MTVSWEALTAVASLVSSVAVLAAVVIAIGQVRVGAQQVEHLRRATQLEGTMKIFERIGGPQQQAARRFVATGLAARMEEPAYRAEVALLSLSPNDHAEMAVLQLMEMVGTYVKNGLIDEDIIFDYWVPVIVNTWEPLARLGAIDMHRASAGSGLWENYELLYDRALVWLSGRPADTVKHWDRRDPDGEPAGTKS